MLDRLRSGWSPEQIAGRLGIEPGALHRLCHETIYRFVYDPRGQSEELARHLPQRRRRRRLRFARKPRSPVFPDHMAIRHRPEAVGRRAELGHWECDLMIFRREHGAANVATVVERTTRHTVLFRNNDRRSKPIMGRLIDALGPLPAEARRSLTAGGGLEFVSWRDLGFGLGARAWLGRPPGAVVRAHGREHQRTAPASSAEGHRSALAAGPDPGGDPRPPQRHSAQVPRMAHPCRSLPRPLHEAAHARLVPCPGSPSHFG